MKNKILILGGNGFVGMNLQKFLFNFYSSDSEVLVADKKEIIDSPFRQAQIDLLNKNKVEELILKENPDYVINLAGIIDSDDVDALLEANVLLPANLLSIFVAHQNLNLKKILLIGSAAEYGSNNNMPLVEDDDLLPVSDYGFSKMVQTDLAKYYGRIKKIPVCVARTFNIIGPNMPVDRSIGSFLVQINNQLEGGAVNTGYLESKRDYLDIEDVCRAYINILLNGLPGEVYNVCSGRCASMRDILEKMISMSGKKLRINSKDNLIFSNISVSCGDNSKLRALGWGEKYNIDQSLEKILR